MEGWLAIECSVVNTFRVWRLISIAISLYGSARLKDFAVEGLPPQPITRVLRSGAALSVSAAASCRHQVLTQLAFPFNYQILCALLKYTSAWMSCEH